MDTYPGTTSTTLPPSPVASIRTAVLSRSDEVNESPDLPITGAEVFPVAGLGLALVAVGAAFKRWGKRS